MNNYCVVGNPIKQSKSPVIHALFAEQLGREISYTRELLGINSFEQELRTLFKRGIRGCNVTVPFKEQAAALCDKLSNRAEIALAVNTVIVQKDNTLLGENTDGVGLVRDLVINHAVSLNNKRILVAGAGGATRGILKPLLDESPQELVICNRTVAKADTLADVFSPFGNIRRAEYSELGSQQFDLIINATSTSLSNEIPPIPASCLSANTTLYDLVYALEPTAFLTWGKDNGVTQLLDGSGMLAEQAAESFFLWEGERPDTADAIRLLKQQ